MVQFKNKDLEALLQQEWRSVNDPPEESGCYIVCQTEHHIISTNYYSKKWNLWNCFDGITDEEHRNKYASKDVLFWMPLLPTPIVSEEVS